ncbi:hypothetical protein HYX17_00020 [Candidatus Woesearchaeota archaeon]|nr:hypothetical protein [Candidatus Woesearchaeota archaeon]
MITALKRYIEQKEPEFTRLDVKILIFLFLISLLIFVLPLLLGRINNVFTEQTYYTLRIAENPFIKFDQFSYGGRPHVFSAWPVIINLFSRALNLSIQTSAVILSVILGTASIILFYLILRKFVNSIISLLSVLILVFSPSYIYSFVTLNDFSFVAFFMLLIIIFMLKDNNIAILFLSFISLFGIIHIIVASLLLIIYSLWRKENKWLLVLPFFFISVIIYLFIYGLPELLWYNVAENKVLINLISDFGSFGLSLFTLILSFFGLLLLWEKKYKNMPIYLSIIFLLVMMNFSVNIILYLGFFLSFIAALGIVRIVDTDWKIKIIRNSIFSILILGIFLSFFIFFDNFYTQEQNSNVIESLKFLDSQTTNNDVVFTHYSKGHSLAYFGEVKNVMDQNFIFAPNLNERFSDSQDFLYTRDLNKSVEIVNKYNINYIWMSKELKDELWDEENEGLQFLLEYSKKFKKIYNQNNMEIWRVED